MVRLLIHVEGETEETFVNNLLAPHLYNHSYQSVSARLIGNSRLRRRRGGIQGWASVRRDIVNHLKEDQGCLSTTMVDYYGLPQAGSGAWPGRSTASNLPFEDKADAVEDAVLGDLISQLGDESIAARFIPFVVVHEFEGLLFSDCQRFSSGIGRPELAEELQRIRDPFSSPEEINDSPITAPSKRVQELIPDYEKPLLGTLAALEIGLDVIRAECAHFRKWLTRIEEWPGLA